MLGTDGIGVALEWLSNHDDIRTCERRPRLTLTIGIPLASSGVVANVTPDVFVFKVFDREVLVVDKDVVPFFVCEGLPNCCSFDLIC